MRLTGHTHDRESPIQNFSTAPKKLGAHISSPVWPPIPTDFVSYLGNLRCDAFTALKSVQSARNESFLAGSDNFHRVRSAIEFEAWLSRAALSIISCIKPITFSHVCCSTSHASNSMTERTRWKLSLPAKKLSFLALWTDLSAVKASQSKLPR